MERHVTTRAGAGTQHMNRTTHPAPRSTAPRLPPLKLPSWQLSRYTMTMNTMTIGLTTRNRLSQGSQNTSKQAVSQRTPRGARRRKSIEAFSKNLPRNYRPKRRHLNPFSPHHFGTKISRFWPPFVELPSLRVVRCCGAFYQPKCPVSRLFLGHRQTAQKNSAGRVPSNSLFSPKTDPPGPHLVLRI